jgi:hypothetical protein
MTLETNWVMPETCRTTFHPNTLSTLAPGGAERPADGPAAGPVSAPDSTTIALKEA